MREKGGEVDVRHAVAVGEEERVVTQAVLERQQASGCASMETGLHHVNRARLERIAERFR